MKSRRPFSLFTHILVLCGLAGLSLGMPGDIATSPGTVAGGSLDASMEIAGGSANVSPSGAFSYSYPLAVPPGRAGMQPSLALSYSSQGALYGGIAAGWSLHVPDIHRDWSRGHHAPERWVSGLAGGRELIPVIEAAPSNVEATFRARGDASYARYQRMKAGVVGVFHRWQVLTADGLRYEFGDSMQPEIDGVAQLRRVVDGFGNSVEYEWEDVRVHPQSLEIIDLRLKKIVYTKNPAITNHHAEVTFEYAPLDLSCGGAPVGAQQLWDTGRVTWRGATRLTSIKTWVRATPTSSLANVRRWDLDYDASAASCSGSHSPIRLLTEIREVDIVGGAPRVRPGVTFEYGDMIPGLEAQLAVQFQPSSAPDKNVGWGTRKETTMLDVQWSTVKAQLLDLDADVRPDRVTSGVNISQSHCEVRWQKNDNAAADVAFSSEALSAVVPAIPWAEGAPPAVGTMNPSIGVLRATV